MLMSYPFGAVVRVGGTQRYSRADYTIEPVCDALVVTDEDQARVALVELLEEEIRGTGSGYREVERGCRLVGDDEFRCADECAGGCDTLLLADRKIASGSTWSPFGQAEFGQDSSGLGSGFQPPVSMRARRSRAKLSGRTTLSITLA